MSGAFVTSVSLTCFVDPSSISARAVGAEVGNGKGEMEMKGEFN